MRTIRQLREAKGWSQAETAHRVGVAPSTIYNWERGKFEPRVAQLRDLAAALGVRMDEIALVADEEGEQGKAAA